MAGSKIRKSKETNPGAQVRVRMYRHGLGDCFLLLFPRDNANDTYNVLIDCGLIAVASDPKPTMTKVVADIGAETGNHLHLVILTHEHWDHTSGFSTQQAQAAFDQMAIDEVWYAWTEDPESNLGRKLYRERAAKLRALHAAAIALYARGEPFAIARAEKITSLLQFFGVSGPGDLAARGGSDTVGKTRLAFEYLLKRRGVKTRYCSPDKTPLRLPGVPGICVYVLGPPQDEGLIKRSSPTKKGKEVYELASEAAGAENLLTAFERLGDAAVAAGGPDCPFEASFSIDPQGSRPLPPNLVSLMDATWNEPKSAWRQIDLDWTAAAETLALNLDSHTNNTCLVVAFELVDSGKVLLFAADAQVGNWRSWQDLEWTITDAGRTRTVTGPALLGRTVFYKVGHHGSHNATLRALGLEQMTSEDLVAFVPVFKDQAEKNRWHKMPFEPLMKRLREKTGGRVVLSDQGTQPPQGPDLGGLSAAERDDFLRSLVINELYYEYAFSM